MKHLLSAVLTLALIVGTASAEPPKQPAKKVDVGTLAPTFKIKDQSGKEIDLAKLTADGPVLVRLTCGCSGCDKELAYFQEIDAAYKKHGLTSLAVFKEPDAKVAEYVKTKKLNMLYAVDTKGESWNVFETKTMPTNFLIDKGGKIVAVAAGCDPSGLLAKKLSDKVAKTLNADPVDVWLPGLRQGAGVLPGPRRGVQGQGPDHAGRLQGARRQGRLVCQGEETEHALRGGHQGRQLDTFETKTMPTNFLIDKGGKIVAVAAGCDPSGLLAKKLSEKVAKTVQAEPVDVKAKVDGGKKEKK
jgi:peroxiredoxin